MGEWLRIEEPSSEGLKRSGDHPPREMTVDRGHVGPRPRWPLRRLPRIPDNRIPWTARAPEPGRDLEIAGRAPGGCNIRGLWSPRKHLELRNSEGFRSLAKELRRRPGTSELRRPPKLEMLPEANRASICPQRLKLGIRRLVVGINAHFAPQPPLRLSMTTRWSTILPRGCLYPGNSGLPREPALLP